MTKDPIDFSAVELTHIKQTRSGDHSLDLDAGTADPMDPALARLAEILARINELFADEDFSESGVQSWVEGVVTVLTENPQLRTQAAANTRKQFVESPDLNDVVTDAVLSNQDTNNRIVDYYLARPEMRGRLVQLLGALVHENVQGEEKTA